MAGINPDKLLWKFEEEIKFEWYERKRLRYIALELHHHNLKKRKNGFTYATFPPNLKAVTSLHLGSIKKIPLRVSITFYNMIDERSN